MKKLFLILTFSLLVTMALVFTVSAKTVYLEEIPDELKVANDTATHFVVFEEERYYTGNNSTIDGFNTTNMDEDMASVGIDATKIGAEYLPRFNVPAYLNGNLITYVNLNAMKSHKYFWDKCGYIQLAGTVEKIHDINEATDQLRCFDFGENSKITEIPYCFAPHSYKLMVIKNFPRNLKVIKTEAFNSCYSAFKGELYLNAEIIEVSAFNNAFNCLEGLVFGPDTQNIGRQSLCTRLSEVPTEYRPQDGILPLKYIEFQCDVAKVTFAEQGNNTGSFYFTGSSRSPYSKLCCIVLSHPDNAKDVKEGSVFSDFLPSGTTVLFNDSNGADDFVTASHAYGDKAISYQSFIKSGTISATCLDCGCQDVKEAAPIFECLGYSVPTFTSPCFIVGYKADFTALTEYENATGSTVNFGILAASKSLLGSLDPLDANGNATVLEKGKVLVARLNRVHNYFDGVVSSFTDEAQKDISIVICAYATVTDKDGNVTTVEYLQSERDSDGSLSGVSYNSILAQGK